MAETEQKVVEKKSLIETTYAYFFGLPLNIDAVYHKMNFTPMVYKYETPDPKDIPSDDEEWKIESMVRSALNMKGSEIDKYFGYNEMNKTRSLLANLVKIKDVQTKKRVLMYFRLLSKHFICEWVKYDSVGRQEDLQNLVARVAAVNGLATYEDYHVLLKRNLVADKKKVFNDLIEQSKMDIKSELALDIPQYNEIERICEIVISCAKDMNLPEKTLKMLQSEFNPDAIIANGNYVEKFAESIELKRAKVDDEEYKLGMFDKMVAENTKLRSENESLKKHVSDLHNDLVSANAMAQGMRASLCSRNVNDYKCYIKELVLKYKQQKQLVK